MDVCGLLKKMEQLQADIGAMRSALKVQVDMCADLHAITTDVNRRVCSLECAAVVTREEGLDARGSAALEAPCSDAGGGSEVGAETEQVTGAAGGAAASSGEREEDEVLAESGEGTAEWSAVVKRRRRLPGAVKTSVRPGTPGARNPRKRFAIVGTGAASHIKTVTTKLSKVTNVWLVNVAIADLIFCFTRIFSIVYKLYSNHWPFGSFLCKINGFFKYTNMFCSVFLLAVISLDRALCIWRPRFIKTKRTLFVARAVCVCVWALAIILSIPYFMHRRVYLDKMNKTKCNINEGKGTDAKLYLYWLRFVCGFLFPFLVILVCYIAAGLGIKRTNLSRKSRTLRILVILVIAFFLCWAPYHCLQLFKLADRYTKVLKPWQRITSAIGYFNSCVNPILYYCLGAELGGCFRLPSCTVYNRPGQRHRGSDE
ncbi:C3a anaphylatoxin chemotactic receptor-like [Periophthalmus magnuspinnatus]|uniref:C3a anaphylatoxin chemotactic receptor-like n=1 Tax=Periophthalmus magnuspinnatus TaxID=409849 RepID=UPI002436BBC4|nr:C3a anaphylatoxin chemotactic receptor-like [Periophthalmus magnuspinnatus]